MAEQKEFRYEIGGRVFYQRPLVLGQLRQLLDKVLKDLLIPDSQDLAPDVLILALGDKLPLGLAIVLSEEGKSLKDKDIEELAKDLEFSITAEQAMEVVVNFFDCTPITSLLNMFTERMSTLTESMKKQIGSENSA